MGKKSIDGDLWKQRDSRIGKNRDVDHARNLLMAGGLRRRRDHVPSTPHMVRAMFQTVPRGWFYRKSGTSSLTWSVPLFLDHSLSEEPILSLPEYSGE